ncbi:MAG: hypothetical protein ACM3VZ_13750 [Acidobacteriota bacterium]
MFDPLRRSLITLTTLGACLPPQAWAQARGKRPLTEGPRVSADPAVIDSGLSARWQAAMSHDLGWAAQFNPVESSLVLDQLDQGQTDVGLFLSIPKADSLDRQGLIYERHTLAVTEVVLVGPTDDVAGIRAETDAGRALTQVIVAASAGKAAWKAPAADSAVASLADQLTGGLASKGLRAGTAPAIKGPAYQLLTRAALARGGQPAGTKIWPLSDPRLALELQVALSFRSRHAAGKLMVTWLQWPLAQGIVGKSQPAWRRVAKS